MSPQRSNSALQPTKAVASGHVSHGAPPSTFFKFYGCGSAASLFPPDTLRDAAFAAECHVRYTEFCG
ncbi:MAG: hypothetical protein IPK82_20345 [Polyangiaceae bacterium]|nr:hypothetical protein [Polyangiaceae bacterium]